MDQWVNRLMRCDKSMLNCGLSALHLYLQPESGVGLWDISPRSTAKELSWAGLSYTIFVLYTDNDLKKQNQIGGWKKGLGGRDKRAFSSLTEPFIYCTYAVGSNILPALSRKASSTWKFLKYSAITPLWVDYDSRQFGWRPAFLLVLALYWMNFNTLTTKTRRTNRNVKERKHRDQSVGTDQVQSVVFNVQLWF